MQPTDNFGDIDTKLSYYKITEGGFALKSAASVVLNVLQNDPFLDISQGIESDQCIATDTSMIRDLVETTAAITERDSRLLEGILT